MKTPRKLLTRAILSVALATGLLALNGATAFAAGAPNVTTSAASGVSLYGATLNGTVDPNGAETTYRFEYGTTTSYGSITAAQTALGEASPVSVAIAALFPETNYHYRITATNSFGTSYGSDQTLKTRRWSVGDQRLGELGESAKYKTQGTFSLKSVVGKNKTPIAFSCTETGEGTLEGSLTLSMSSCVVSEPSTCILKPFTLQLNSAMSFKELYGTLRFEKCVLVEEAPILGGGFLANTGYENVKQPVTLEGRGVLFGTKAAEVTDTSTWHLIEKQEGKRFGLNWYIGGTPLEPSGAASFTVSPGTATFSFVKVPGRSVSCKVSSGSGQLNGTKELTLSNCEIKGWGECEVTYAAPVKLKGDFSPLESNLITLFETRGSRCGAEGGFGVMGTGFTVTAGAEKTALPVSLSLLTTNLIQVEISSTWSLTGFYAGLAFGTGPS